MSGKAEKGAGEGTAYLLSVAVGKRVLQAANFRSGALRESLFLLRLRVEKEGAESEVGSCSWVIEVGRVG